MNVIDRITYLAVLPLTDEFIDDTLSTAFEGGSNYWVDSVKALNDDFKGMTFASQVVSKGGALLITPDEDPYDDVVKPYILNLDTFREGVKRYINENGTEPLDDVDAGIADEILQFALFREVVFG